MYDDIQYNTQTNKQAVLQLPTFAKLKFTRFWQFCPIFHLSIYFESFHLIWMGLPIP